MRADVAPRRISVSALIVVLAAPLLFAGCAGDFAVRRVDPLRAASQRPPTSSPAEILAAGVRAQRLGDRNQAGGYYLDALERLAAAPPSDETNEARRFATARLVEICAPRRLADSAPLVFVAPDSPTRRYRVTLRRGAGRGGIEPAKFTALEPADRFVVSSVPVMSVRPGIGAPLVARLPPVAPFHKSRQPAQPIAGLNWAATAVATLGPVRAGVRPVALELYEPHQAETVIVGTRARRQPLAADFTTPLAVSGSLQSARRTWLTSFFRGDAYFSNAGLYPIESPSPDKIPVVLVHGLLSDPSYFRYLVNALANDPEIRRRYQFWAFFYPTALPVPASADLLRTSIARQVSELDPDGTQSALHRIVILGHSMGGLLTRLSVSGSGGDTLYCHYFRKPIDELRVSPENRALLRRVFFFPPDPKVRAAVFIATPHRGSDLALSPLGGIGRMLAGLPATMSTTLSRLVKHNVSALANPEVFGENSILGLSPRSPVVKAMDKIPLSSRRTRIYSIIGDRGRAGPLQESSDGIVPYRSSHLPQAHRETIVHAGHSGILKAPATTAEVARALLESAATASKWP